jgi:hypothetical protein
MIVRILIYTFHILPAEAESSFVHMATIFLLRGSIMIILSALPQYSLFKMTWVVKLDQFAGSKWRGTKLHATWQAWQPKGGGLE